MRSIKFLIVGQGLAGSLLAYSLVKRGQSVMVLDNNHQGSATQVAAGLINPITGHRLNITNGFFDYAEKARKLYWQIERDLGCSVYSEIAQTRLIKNAGQAEYLEKRKRQAEYQSLLDSIDNTGSWFTERDKFPYGGINVSRTAVVDTKNLVRSIQLWLEDRSSLLHRQVDYAKLISDKGRFKYSLPDVQLEANQVIFCEGFQAINNPWLINLPFKLAKGEILTLKPQQRLDRMLSWGNWLVPFANNKAKLGSNYIWNDTSLTKSHDAANAFHDNLRKFTGMEATTLLHEVGIRPSTKYRQPFVGPLTNLDNSYCLNGLGSKGCLVAPYYVEQLCDHLLKDKALPDENTRWL